MILYQEKTRGIVIFSDKISPGCFFMAAQEISKAIFGDRQRCEEAGGLGLQIEYELDLKMDRIGDRLESECGRYERAS